MPSMILRIDVAYFQNKRAKMDRDLYVATHVRKEYQEIFLGKFAFNDNLKRVNLFSFF